MYWALPPILSVLSLQCPLDSVLSASPNFTSSPFFVYFSGPSSALEILLPSRMTHWILPGCKLRLNPLNIVLEQSGSYLSCTCEGLQRAFGSFVPVKQASSREKESWKRMRVVVGCRVIEHNKATDLACSSVCDSGPICQYFHIIICHFSISCTFLSDGTRFSLTIEPYISITSH